MLKNKFQSAQTAIASYDYTDIASGTGYSIFYGANVATGAAASEYILADTVIYSEKITTWAEVTQAATKWMDIDFDIEFKRPQQIEGDMILNVPIGINRKTANAGGTMTAYLTGDIIHYDGTTETVLATYRSYNFVHDDTVTAGNTKTLAIKVTIPATKFKIGDILRVDMEGWSSINIATNRLVGIGHDPKNQKDPGVLGTSVTIYKYADTTYGSTVMEVHVPFRIDI